MPRCSSRWTPLGETLDFNKNPPRRRQPEKHQCHVKMPSLTFLFFFLNPYWVFFFGIGYEWFDIPKNFWGKIWKNFFFTSSFRSPTPAAPRIFNDSAWGKAFCLRISEVKVSCYWHLNKHQNHIPSSKLTWQWKITIFNRKYIFKWWIFHCHVSLRGIPTSVCVFSAKQQNHWCWCHLSSIWYTLETLADQLAIFQYPGKLRSRRNCLGHTAFTSGWSQLTSL